MALALTSLEKIWLEFFSQKTFLRKFYTRGRVTYGDDGRLGLRRTQSRKLAPETRGNCEPPARRERIGIRTQRAKCCTTYVDELARLNDIYESTAETVRIQVGISRESIARGPFGASPGVSFG